MLIYLFICIILCTYYTYHDLCWKRGWTYHKYAYITVTILCVPFMGEFKSKYYGLMFCINKQHNSIDSFPATSRVSSGQEAKTLQTFSSIIINVIYNKLRERSMNFRSKWRYFCEKLQNTSISVAIYCPSRAEVGSSVRTITDWTTVVRKRQGP